MAKPTYENEGALRKYITSLIKGRTKEEALSYINVKLNNYNFSSDFLEWIETQKKILKGEIKPNMAKITKPSLPPAAPSIPFGFFDIGAENEHLLAVKRQIKFIEGDLFDRIGTIKSQMADLKDSIRYSNFEDRPDFIRQHLEIAHTKGDLQ